ncbi:hypothetical protein [Marivirga sericea]|nr:hypothetical protein [Marivirga sericea]
MRKNEAPKYKLNRLEIYKGLTSSSVVLQIETNGGIIFTRSFFVPYQKPEKLISYFEEYQIINKENWIEQLPIGVVAQELDLKSDSVILFQKNGKIEKLAFGETFVIGENENSSEISLVDFFGILILLIGLYFTYLFFVITIKLLMHYKQTGELANFEFPDLIGDSISGWKELLGKKK